MDICVYAGQTFWPNARCQNYTRKHGHTHMYAKQLPRSLLVAGCVLFKILRHVNIKGPARCPGPFHFAASHPRQSPSPVDSSRVLPSLLGSQCCITPFDLCPTVRVRVRARVCVRACHFMACCMCGCLCWDPLRVLTAPFGRMAPTLQLQPAEEKTKRNICKCCFPLGCYYFKFFAYACFAVPPLPHAFPSTAANSSCFLHHLLGSQTCFLFSLSCSFYSHFISFCLTRFFRPLRSPRHSINLQITIIPEKPYGKGSSAHKKNKRQLKNVTTPHSTLAPASDRN